MFEHCHASICFFGTILGEALYSGEMTPIHFVLEAYNNILFDMYDTMPKDGPTLGEDMNFAQFFINYSTEVRQMANLKTWMIDLSHHHCGNMVPKALNSNCTRRECNFISLGLKKIYFAYNNYANMAQITKGHSLTFCFWEMIRLDLLPSLMVVRLVAVVVSLH